MARKASTGELRVGLYARVSTTEQDVEVQLRELREYVARRGWAVAAEYVDAGVSGARTSRPALDRLMRDARQRRIDAVVVWALDRLGRSLRHLVLTLDELAALGVGFVSFTQPIDSTSPAGRLTMQVLAAVAEFERELIRERVRAGVAKARSAGKRLGRPPAEVDEDQVLALRDAGLSLRQIAARVGAGKGVVARVLAETGGRRRAS